MRSANKYFFLLFFLPVSLVACYTQQPVNTVAMEQPIAFPGAEGFGKYTTGGRGGKIMIVSNLEDDGEGSFRKAVTAKGARIIVFTVSGTIHLRSPLIIKGNVTIAGQTAPGDGICLADQPVGLGGDNIVIRFLRFRMGDRYQNKGKLHGAGHDDALGGSRKKLIIIDHCSISWSTDECISVYAGDSTTLQWNLISEPLNYSYHFEEGDTDFERHGFGGIWGGRHFTAHHNLFAHCLSRTPRFDGTRNSEIENCDFRNNVIYNWGSNNVHAGEGGNYNIVNNYYKYGPSTKESVRKRIANPFNLAPRIPFGKWHIDGNHSDGFPMVTEDNWLGVVMQKGSDVDASAARADRPFPGVVLNTEKAVEAYESVLKNAGAIFPSRDTLDQRIITDVRNRTGKIIDVQGGYSHGTSYEISSTAWPVLQSKPSATDGDLDGMPDSWEKQKGLDPANPADANVLGLHTFYTNIEVYLNELVK
jgi:pectate lyase